MVVEEQLHHDLYNRNNKLQQQQHQYKKDLLTDGRKIYYENKQIDNLKLYRKIILIFYYIFLVIYVIVILFKLFTLKLKLNYIIILFICLYAIIPFILKYIIDLIYDFFPPKLKPESKIIIIEEPDTLTSGDEDGGQRDGGVAAQATNVVLITNSTKEANTTYICSTNYKDVNNINIPNGTPGCVVNNKNVDINSEECPVGSYIYCYPSTCQEYYSLEDNKNK